MSDRPGRDAMLEAALATLAAPAMKERFHERLWERVDAVESPLLVGSLAAPQANERFHERLWERIDAAEARPAAVRARRRWSWRPRLAAAALVAATAAAVATIWLGGWPAGRDHGLAGPPPAVAQVIKQVSLRLDSSKSLSAVFTYQRTGRPAFRARILATADGRMRTTAVAGPGGAWRLPPEGATLANTPGLHVEVTSQPDGTRTEAWDSASGLTVSRTVGLAPGPPDAVAGGLFPAEFASQLGTLPTAGARVSSSTYEGRRALVVSAPSGPAASGQAGSAGSLRYDKVSMTIDRETWLPVRVVRSLQGRIVESWSLGDVRLDPKLVAADFAVQLPSSAELVTGRDQAFRRVSLAQAGKAIRGRLFVPDRLPAGFTLSLATVKIPDRTLEKPWLSGESAVASLVYRRGFRSIVVTTRSFHGRVPDPAHDPFAGTAAAGRGGARRVLLRGGGLAGEYARLSARPLDLPHAWVRHDGSLVTVAGDVGSRELRGVAESLDAYTVWRTRETFEAYTAATKAYDQGAFDRLSADGVRIDGRSYSPDETEDAIIRNSEQADYFISGSVVSSLVGPGMALREAWPGSTFAVGGWYSPEAVAELVTMHGDKVVRQDFFWITGPSLRAGETSPHPAGVRTPLDSGDTAASARHTGLVYAAALKAMDAARLARMSAHDVAFLDVGYGDHGGRVALRNRYERMFRFPGDLAFRAALVASGPGWAAIRWTAGSAALGYDRSAGLTVLELRHGEVARETLYCAKDRMPFR